MFGVGYNGKGRPQKYQPSNKRNDAYQPYSSYSSPASEYRAAAEGRAQRLGSVKAPSTYMQPQAPAPLRLSSFTGFTRDRTGGGDSDSAGFTQDRTSGGMDSVGVESVGGFSFQSDVSISGNPPVLATSQVQPYTVIKEIGGGGAGKAYIVTGKADGKRYVAKQIICLSDQYSAAQASYALQETRLLFLLQHPHICKLVDFYPKSANFFIIMEYCEQGDLGRHITGAIQRGGVKFDVPRVYTWWYQILDAVEFCHSKGVLHRDLKPKNIFVDAKLNIKLGDFGVSALLSSPPSTQLVGTVAYHAPEVRSSLSFSVKSDVWAIGIIMWETMSLQKSKGEPMQLEAINFDIIVPIYGDMSRDLISMHLTEQIDKRRQAGTLKELLLHSLPEDTRYTVVSRSYTSGLQHPDSIQSEVPTQPYPNYHADTLDDAVILPGHEAQWKQSDVNAETVTAGVFSDYSSYQDMSKSMVAGMQPEPTSVQCNDDTDDIEEAKVETPEVLELSEELGIFVSACMGGELGAWKIASLPNDKPAAKCRDISVGHYLWEINEKVIFGLPFPFVESLIKGRTSEVSLGVKKGLGQPIRKFVIRKDGPSPETEATASSAASPAQDDTDLMKQNPAMISAKTSPITSADGERSSIVTKGGSLIWDAKAEDGEDTEKKSLTPEETPQTIMGSEDVPQVTTVPSPLQGSGIENVERRRNVNPEDIDGPESADGNKDGTGTHLENVKAPPRTPELQPKQNHVLWDKAMHEEVTSPVRHAMTSPKITDHATSSNPSQEADLVLSINDIIIRSKVSIRGDGEYEGELYLGKPFGRGTATWVRQGHTYVGEWRNGVMHGRGTATYLNGDRYDGEWSNGKRKGLGRYTHGSGDMYEGLWSNERKHGLGVDSFSNGCGYRGEFLENKFSGMGTYYTVEGAVYQGEWFQGRAHGSGISNSTTAKRLACVEYSHGNLTNSTHIEDPEQKGSKQLEVEKVSRSAIAVALLARRLASSIQVKCLEAPTQYQDKHEVEVLDEFLPIAAGTSLLGKALEVLLGLHTKLQEDSSLLVTTLDSADDVPSILPGNTVHEVASRSCSWYKGMTLDEIMALLEMFQLPSRKLVISVKTADMASWVSPNHVVVSIPTRMPIS